MKRRRVRRRRQGERERKPGAPARHPREASQQRTPEELPDHRTSAALRQASLVQMQQSQGNSRVQQGLRRKQKQSAATTEADEEAAVQPSGLERTEGEEEMTVEQVVRSEEQKADHIPHATKAETDAGLNGHLDEWIEEKHTVKKKGEAWVVSIDKLDLHTQVYVWPKATPGKWDNIKDFGPYYGGPYDAGFNIYEGTLAHEEQHAVEAKNAFALHEPALRADVTKIKEKSKADAEAAYQKCFATFRDKYNKAYWANGETDGYRVEWDYYHSQYALFKAGELVSEIGDAVASGVDSFKGLFGF